MKKRKPEDDNCTSVDVPAYVGRVPGGDLVQVADD